MKTAVAAVALGVASAGIPLATEGEFVSWKPVLSKMREELGRVTALPLQLGACFEGCEAADNMLWPIGGRAECAMVRLPCASALNGSELQPSHALTLCSQPARARIALLRQCMLCITQLALDVCAATV